jgi:hypothetical protein
VDVTEVCGGDWSSKPAGAEASEAGLGESTSGFASGLVCQSVHGFVVPGFAKLPHGLTSRAPQWSYSYVSAAAFAMLAAISSQSSLNIFSAKIKAALHAPMSLMMVASWIDM